MKKILLNILLLVVTASTLPAQNNYPDPEFTNEVYSYPKDHTDKLLRLEKNSSKMDTKTKMGGMAGMETSYVLEGTASPVRISDGTNLSFVFSKAPAEGPGYNMDSLMKANGIDPATAKNVPGMGGSDPASSITLYKATVDKTQRKIYLQKMGGMFGAKKPSSSDKYSFSVKKIREGYWELVIDKPLPKGEYAFSMAAGMGMGNMDGSVSLFAFGVD